jgi:hypothetical protein
MQWSATDQFGNLNTADSDATTVAELAPHLASLLEELRARAGDQIQITVDLDYSEIAGPAPDHVSHILRAPNLSCFHSDQSPEEVRSEIAEAVEAICAQQGQTAIPVGLA